MINLRQFFLKTVTTKKFLRLLVAITVLFLVSELYFRYYGKFDTSFSQNVGNSLKFIFNPPLFKASAGFKKKPEEYSSKASYQFIENPVYDNEYGYRMTPDCKCRDILKLNNTPLWDVTYYTDQFGRRITSAAGNSKKTAEQFTVFFGGSRTFGQGVNDDETLASNFQKLNPEIKVYNYGIVNSAANTYLRYFETGKFQREIPEKKGVFIYVYDLGHEEKILGTKESTKSFFSPLYEYDENGKITYYKNFWHTRPVRSFFYNLLGLSAVYQNLFLNKRPDQTVLESDELFLIRDIFLQMQKQAAEMNGSKFVVIFFEVVRSPIMIDVSRVLKEAGIEVLYYKKDQLPADDNINYYEFDRHPKASTYVIQAALIQEALKQKSWFKK